MSKEYYCNQRIGKEVCGESDPSKFQKGRYSSCKECRNKYIRNYNKQLREEEKIVKKMEITDKITENKGDLGNNVHNLIVHILETYPLRNIGIALPIKLEDIKTDMIKDYTYLKGKNEESETKLQKQINTLKQENTMLKNELQDLKGKLSKNNILNFNDD
jgi:hypothetical protein